MTERASVGANSMQMMHAFFLENGDECTSRLSCASKRIQLGRSLAVKVATCRRSISRFLQAVEAHCRPAVGGSVVFDSLAARSLSARAQVLTDELTALIIHLEGLQEGRGDAGSSVAGRCQVLDLEAQYADADSAARRALAAIAPPAERWAEPRTDSPEGLPQLYRKGDVVLQRDLEWLRRGMLLLELATPERTSGIAVAEAKKRKRRAPRQLGAPTERQMQCYVLYEELKNYAAVGRRLELTRKTVREHVLAAKRSVEGEAHVRMRRPRTQALPKGI